MEGDLIIGECDLVADLHLVEKPIRVALENLGKMYADIARRLTETIHDPAQGCLVNAQHASKAVLANPGRVHAQLKVWIDVSIQGHSSALFFYGAQPIWLLLG